jgi:seryl-tRNA synthetase
MSDSESVTEQKIGKEKFKEIVAEWMTIVDKLAEIRQSTAVLNKRKKKLNESIVAFMEQNNAEYCNMGDSGSIEMKKHKTTSTLKKDVLINLLQQLGNSEEDSAKTAIYIMENRPVKYTSVLKRKQ